LVNCCWPWPSQSSTNCRSAGLIVADIRQHSQSWFRVSSEPMTILFLKNAVFWGVAPCGFIINQRFGGTCRPHLQGRKFRCLLTVSQSVSYHLILFSLTLCLLP
jgi:hypothetical protein